MAAGVSGAAMCWCDVRCRVCAEGAQQKELNKRKEKSDLIRRNAVHWALVQKLGDELLKTKACGNLPHNENKFLKRLAQASSF